MRRPLLTLTTLLAFSAHSLQAGEVTLRPASAGKGVQLLRDGIPYLVRGGGGSTGSALESLRKYGGNSVRLWGDENLGATLDAAQKLGLTVTAGIWLGQVRQGAKWDDPAFLKRNSDHIRSVVEKYKNHPALLCWALGNEMEDPQGKNTAVWTGINGFAAMVKELDPNHPTMTVVAEIGGDKVPNIHKLCPAIDIVGINSYGGAASVAERYAKAGGTKPYMLTEYGPNGIWEVQRNALGGYSELTSTAKAESYRRAYMSAVLNAPGACVGSYAFLWGYKQEVTSTWFSMFLPDGSRLAAVDAIKELWSGQPLKNLCPAIDSLTVEGNPIGKPGETIRAKLSAKDPESDPLKVEWYLEGDPGQYGSGGDHEAAPPKFPEALLKGDLTCAEIKLPEGGGLYRLFAIVRDGQGGAAAANVLLKVEAPAAPPKARPATLPFAIYTEDGAPQNFVPAGWMGDTQSVKMNPGETTQPHSGKTCLKVEFTTTKGWAGVTWQNPPGDWGDRPGGYDFTGAKKITFWARGENGGEIVNFEFGTIAKTKKFGDTANGALPKVALTKEWKRYEIPVSGDLTRIKPPFVWNLASAGKPVTFYLDDVQWE